MFRIGTDAHLYDDPDDVNIAPLLDSKFDSEKCEALKRLLALIAQGFDVSNFFPQVVKNVSSQSLEVKKLVYLYLLHYAEKRPNEALLSINHFQKDLGDTNPLVRAWALRTMAGIRLHMIAPLVLVAVNKCARDPSVYVRKCAANALLKLHDLRLEENTAAIERLVGILLNDNSPAVIGAAAAAFASICPNNLTLVGRNYRRLCETLPDVEEWGQVILIGILLRYVIARHGLVRESIMMYCHFPNNNASEKEGSSSYLGLEESRVEIGKLCRPEIAHRITRSYLEGPDKYLSSSTLADAVSSSSDALPFTSYEDNDDVNILLKCTSPLLWSHNSAVVLAAAGVHWIMAPLRDVERIAKPLLFILRSSSSSKFVVLCNIQVFAKAMPSLFMLHFEDFFINSLDSYEMKALKLEILTSIASDSSISDIFQEFQDYITDPDRRFAADTVAAIGLCAQQFPQVVDTCLEGLLALISSDLWKSDVACMDGDSILLIQAIHSIKEIVRNNPSRHEKVIVHLIRTLDSIRVSAARAMIIWMLGEFSNTGCIIPKLLPTVLKYLAFCFVSEEKETKLQIVNACTKVLLRTKGENFWIVRKILSYMLDLGRYDLDYDIRDRARLVNKLLSCYLGSSDAEDAKALPDIKASLRVLAECVFVGQVRAISSEPVIGRFYLPGSLSHVVLHAAPGYEPLPQPISLVLDSGLETNITGDDATPSESHETDDPDSVSGSLDEESGSDYSSQDSDPGSDGSRASNTSVSVSEIGLRKGPLIHLSDIGNSENVENIGPIQSNLDPKPGYFGELMSEKALESWLEDNQGPNHSEPALDSVRQSSARISVGNISSRIKPKSYLILDPSNGNGLKVSYVFSSEASNISSFVCVQVSFENCSTEPMANIQLVEENSADSVKCAYEASSVTASSSSHGDVPNLVPMKEIPNLEPGETTMGVLHVHFNHHLLPLKLILWCNDKTHPVKLRPDIGYFLKPLPMDYEVFSRKEAQLRGMFECTRRCTFVDHIGELKKVNGTEAKDHYLVICEGLAVKMLSNVNLYLVSVDMPVSANLNVASGLSLRFSGELLSDSVPCLVTLALEGTCFEPLNVTVKINCEETVFSLNLLNRIVNFLAEAVSE